MEKILYPTLVLLILFLSCLTINQSAAMTATETWGGGIGGPIPAPKLLYPENQIAINDDTPTFDWENELPADNFQLQVDNDPDFSSPEIDVVRTTSDYTLSNGLPEGVYYWRVQMTRSGAASSWSEIRNFRVLIIKIFSNADFTAQNGVTSGSGTAADPYIIENWVIDARSSHGIWIENTTANFIIRNCTIENGSSYNGIYLENVKNGKIENCHLRKNYIGIFLSDSTNNVIKNSWIENNYEHNIKLFRSDNNQIIDDNLYVSIFSLFSYDIFLENSHNNKIENNHVGGREDFWNYGIYLSNAENNYIFGNIVENIGGISLYSSENNTLENNYLENCLGYGISLSHSENNLIQRNLVENSTYGIYLSNSENNRLLNNISRNNSIWGIYLGSSGGSYFRNNIFENNRWNYYEFGSSLNDYIQDIDNSNRVNAGPIISITEENDLVINEDNEAGFLRVVNCDNILVENLMVEGIILAFTNNSRIQQNTTENEYIGILLYSSENNTLRKNISDNEYCGLYLNLSDNNYLENNQIENGAYGIIIYYSTNAVLENNFLENNILEFSVLGENLIHFYHQISDTNQVNGKPILYLVEENNIVINQDNQAGYLGIVGGENLVVENLTLENSYQGILMAGVENARVENCRFLKNYYGVHVWKSQQIVLDNNYIDNSSYANVEIDSSSLVTLTYNKILNSYYVGVFLSSSDNNTIENNLVKNNSDDGIYLANSTNNTISYNIVENNSGNGISISGFYGSHNNIISNNTVRNNSTHGIYLDDSDNNIVRNNIVENNRQSGIYLYISDNNTISFNTLKNNLDRGIYLDPVCTGNFIEVNELINNTTYGIPNISSVSVTNITETSATITWSTVETSTSKVYYDTSQILGNVVSDETVTTSHSITLTGLTAGTTYYYKVESKDADNNREISQIFSFTTLSPSLPPSPTPSKLTTELTIAPSTFTLGSGGSITLTATLEDSEGQPLSGKTISWSAEHGTFSATSTTTDNSGQVTVVYTAPLLVTSSSTTLTDTITASFSGDEEYEATQATATATITSTQPAGTSISISPLSFTVRLEENITLTATLTDNAGNPLADKTIEWTASVGTISPSTSVTDSAGTATATYIAPIVENETTVTITATFAGGNLYAASSATVTGRVTLIPTSLSIQLPSLVVGSGENLSLSAILLADGEPLDGATVSWAASPGEIVPASSTTDSSGNASATYSAPTVSLNTPVTITASYAGDEKHLPSTITVTITVLPQEQMEILDNLKENLESVGEEFEIPLENENIVLIENAFATGKLGAVVTIKIEVDIPGVAKGYEHENVGLRPLAIKPGEEIVLEVESTENQKIIVVNIENEVLPVGWISKILVDNVEIEMADNFSDILNPTNENVPEYLILKGGKGAQILISIPYFSARTITITTLPTVPAAGMPSVYLFALAALLIIIITLAVIWRYLSLGRKKFET